MAIDDLFKQVEAELIRFWRAHLNTEDAAQGAEDLVQDTFKRVWTWSLEDGGQVPTKGIVFGFARNILHEYWRRGRPNGQLGDHDVVDKKAADPAHTQEVEEAGGGQSVEPVDRALGDVLRNCGDKNRDVLLSYANSPKGSGYRAAVKDELNATYPDLTESYIGKIVSDQTKRIQEELLPFFDGAIDKKQLVELLQRHLKHPVHLEFSHLSHEKLVAIISKCRANIAREQSAALRKPTGPAQVKYLQTGFPALDTLLGGKGLRLGSCVVLRGKSATGKTTLALQIGKHAISKLGLSFVFASIEDEPATLLDYVTNAFWNTDYKTYLGDPDRYHVEDLSIFFDKVEGEVFQQIVGEVEDQAAAGESQGQTATAGRYANRTNHRLVSRLDDAVALREETKAVGAINAQVRGKKRLLETNRLLSEFWQKLPVPKSQPVLVVVDSLNALVNSANAQFSRSSDRQMLLAVLRSLKAWRRQHGGQLTVILLTEDDDQTTNLAASYMADAVIELGSSTMEHAVYETARRSTQWKQDLLFCRVLKGRGLPVQRRSCCYEFVVDKKGRFDAGGINFLPTFAAPGIVSLFYENKPMREVIRNLRTNDVPALYPQVIVQEFNRTALQRIYSVRRRSSSITLRHPMMLSNVDEYWFKVLLENNLLEPIPARMLNVFSLAPNEPTASSCAAPFIDELIKSKPWMRGEENGEVVYYGIPQIANVGMMVYRKDLLAGKAPPRTWEDLEQICRDLENDGKSHQLLLETVSHDSFLATALELAWSHGAFWRTVAYPEGVRIEFDKGSGPDDLVAALTRLQRWIHADNFVPRGSSVDDRARRTNWAFARHWYSTWIDGRSKADERATEEFGILPIPVAQSVLDRTKGNAKHHSAWGEWYLVIQRGSENVELGIDLINNLMTARKVTERALSGAALPTVQRFYELSDERAPGTDLTFGQIREQFFADARSRTDFHNYPEFARVFSGVLRTIATNPAADVTEAVKKTFRNIDPSFEWH